MGPPTPSAKTFAAVTTLTNSEQGIKERSHITTPASAQNQENVSLLTVTVWLSVNEKHI